MSEENQETKNQEKSDSSSKKDFKQSEQTTKAADTKDSDKKNVSEIKTNEKVDDKDIKKSSNDKPKTEKSGISSAQVDKPNQKIRENYLLRQNQMIQKIKILNVRILKIMNKMIPK